MTFDSNVLRKIKKIKALAEKGIGGEKETAIKMYHSLMKKYNLSETEIAEEIITEHWFKYDGTKVKETLLLDIFYTVTGDNNYITYIDRRKRFDLGIKCTQAEAMQIEFLFNYYSEKLDEELKAFMLAFRWANNLMPDKTTRCYTENPEKRLTDEEEKLCKKADNISYFLNHNARPYGAIEKRKEK